METLVTAYLVNHDPLLKAASDFIFQNRPIKKDSYWDKIKTTYPEIATKILDLVVFNVKEEDLKKDWTIMSQQKKYRRIHIIPKLQFFGPQIIAATCDLVKVKYVIPYFADITLVSSMYYVCTC